MMKLIITILCLLVVAVRGNQPGKVEKNETVSSLRSSLQASLQASLKASLQASPQVAEVKNQLKLSQALFQTRRMSGSGLTRYREKIEEDVAEAMLEGLHLHALKPKQILIVEAPGQDWEEAKAGCESMDMKLITLATYAEVEHMAQLIKPNTFYWIGAHCENCHGGQQYLKPNPDKWTWVTGEHMAFPFKYWSGIDWSGVEARAPRSVTLSKSKTGEIFLYTWVADSRKFSFICQFWTPITK